MSDPDPADAGDPATPAEALAPLDALRVLGVQEKAVGDGVDHVELYTLEGLVTLLWHGPRDAHDVVLMSGGAMGGLLGPAEGLYHDLGVAFSALGIGTIRVGYRRPNDLDRCVMDVAAAADIAGRVGARRFVAVGHSFGGAVAVNVGIALGRHAAGVVTLATQSAGCEHADLLACPLLLVHGDTDELLPPMASEMVRMIVGHGELEVIPGAGHLLKEAGPFVRQRVGEWIPERFAEAPPSPGPPESTESPEASG